MTPDRFNDQSPGQIKIRISANVNTDHIQNLFNIKAGAFIHVSKIQCIIEGVDTGTPLSDSRLVQYNTHPGWSKRL